jgi:DNA-binding transcriptional ArsR family regulator
MAGTTPRADADRILAALGDPTRRRMVEALGAGPLSVSALAAPFDMTLTAIVQHLRVLEECGLVVSEKIGRVRSCRLDPAGLDALAGWVAARRSPWERRLDRLAGLIAGDD